jgi:hypothetical protein
MTEPLQEAAWIWDVPLALTRDAPYPHEGWVLDQGGRPIAAIDQASGGWSLTTPTHRCSAVVRRRRRRLGWHVAVTSAEHRSPLLEYRPSTVRSGGILTRATGDRYKLRCLARLGYDWTLSRADGDTLARISPPNNQSEAFPTSRGPQLGLAPAAAREPDLALLLASACVAIITHSRPGSGDSPF